MNSSLLKRFVGSCYPTFHVSSAARSRLFCHQVRRREGLCISRAPIFRERCFALHGPVPLSCFNGTAFEPKDVFSLRHVRGMAGHSKWQNIRHIKAAKDAEKAATNEKFTRIIRAIVREGGIPDPNLNPKLGQIVEQAVKKNVPKATIENAIKASVKSKEALEPATVEVKGPGGCFLIVELLTDNLVRSKQTIRSVLNKTRSSMLDGSARHFFEHKGVINVKVVDGITLEKATEDAIVAGAEDLREDADEDGTSVIQFLTDPREFYSVKKNLEEMKYEIYSCGVKYLACVKHKMRDEDLPITEKLFDLLERVPEVVNIYDNIE